MNPAMHPLEAILRRCAEAAPEPWYPSRYAQAAGVSRESLDPYLDELRLGGLVRLTDWVQGTGQGYTLTPEGREVLENPSYLVGLINDGPVPRLVHPESRPPAPPRPVHERTQAIREQLTRPAIPVVTLTLIVVNVLWFLWGFAVCSNLNVPTDAYLEGRQAPAVLKVSHRLGAMYGSDVVVEHQWWRLVTACFVHFGWIHLGSNMLSLYFIGPLLERMWGSGRYLLLYAISGLAGSGAMVVWGGPPLGGGASGAILGIFAAMLPWVVLNRRYLPPHVVSRWLSQVVLLLFLNIGLTLSIPLISKEAHFGGSIAGVVVAVPVFYTLYGTRWQRALAWAVLVAGVAVGTAWFITFVLRGAP